MKTSREIITIISALVFVSCSNFESQRVSNRAVAKNSTQKIHSKQRSELKSVSNGNVTEVNANGVTYFLPFSSSSSSINNGDVTLVAGKFTLEARNGHLKVNQVDYGTVQAGDTVKLTEDGKIFVNGNERNSK